MTEDSTSNTSSSGRRGSGLPTWKVVLLVASGVMAIAGLAIGQLGADGPAKSNPRPSAPTGSAGDNSAGPSSSLAPQSFLPQEHPTPSGDGNDTNDASASTQASADAAIDYSPLLTKVGFGFFLGFAMGYALRMFFKISLLAVGVIALGVVGLQYAGMIDVDWSAMQGHYETIADWARGQFTNLRGFISGQIPSSASAGFGLMVGFSKR